MSELKMVPFSKLTASDEINARAKSKEGIDELAASIAAKGLIQPLAVRAGDGGKFEVIDGRRRFMALQKLVKDGAMKRTEGVPVLERDDDDTEALETSLMANTVRLPMHPVDQHIVFDRLVSQGKSEAEIAARFGIGERIVKQHLALGRLAPSIRDAWKKDKISPDVAKAFARHGNVEVQEAICEKLRKDHGGYRFGVHQVTHALSDQRIALAACFPIKVIGLDAYLAAGGKISDDLFDDQKYVDDVPLAQKLVDDKAAAKCAELLADGWAFAMPESEVQQKFGYGWESWDNVKDMPPDDPFDIAAAFDPSIWSADEKAASGCIVEILSSGEFHVNAGMISPAGCAQKALDAYESDDEDGEDFGGDDDAPSAAAEANDDESDGAGISATLMRTLTETLTLVASATMQRQPDLALRAAVTSLVCRGGFTGNPVKLSANGWPEHARPLSAAQIAKFSDTFAAFSAATNEDLLRNLACLVADALDLRSFGSAAPNANDKALIAALDGAIFTAEARRYFNASDYFTRIKKALVLDAIDEMREGGFGDGIAPEDVLAGMKKSELASAAADLAIKCGWLPPELRHPSYALGAVKIAVAAE
ncbi:ParB/RepB/Spo0J family partition protein [Hyphomicrobium sp. MC8b]|uniref:ParB/RepB/Spo0J family partition protein n=1 Tax=Hyphomicrobium sp. MC8b TaxID=300273 RepID=UPI00391BFEF1